MSVDHDPPPDDPLEHRYRARERGREQDPAGAGPGGVDSRDTDSNGAEQVPPQDRPRPGAPLGRTAAAPGPDEAADGWAFEAPISAEAEPARELPDPPAAQPAARVPATIEEVLAGLGTRAFRFAELGLRHREDALDAVQDAMMKMLAYRERPAQEWTPLFWSILRSRIVDVQRRRSFRLRWLMPAPREDDAPLDWADEGPDPQRTHDGREAYARLADALAKLPRRQREAFSLRILEELDVATTARAMGCSEGAVKTHLSRAREALQRQLEEWR